MSSFYNSRLLNKLELALNNEVKFETTYKIFELYHLKAVFEKE